MMKFGIFLLGLFCLIYLLNPGAGIFELISDNLPLIGNMDRAATVATLLMRLKCFGINLPDFSHLNKDIAPSIGLFSRLT